MGEKDTCWKRNYAPCLHQSVHKKRYRKKPQKWHSYSIQLLRFHFHEKMFLASRNHSDDAKWSREPFYNESIFYCTINGLALLACSWKPFFLSRFPSRCARQWCMKRAKMETTDDADENYMLLLMHQFLLFLSFTFPTWPAFYRWNWKRN